MLEFIKNIEPDFNIAEIPLKTEKLKLDNKSHYENAAIKGLDRVASTQNKVWNENLPRDIVGYIKEFGFDKNQYSANINVQYPGQMAPLHIDNHSYACQKLNKNPEDFDRVLIFLTDWSIGQVFGCGEESITGWKSGDCYSFDSKDQHFSANTGMETKYTIVLSGLKGCLKK
jgi:hypothetical protein